MEWKIYYKRKVLSGKMFNWFKEKDKKEEVKEIKIVNNNNKNNYEIKENGDIKIKAEVRSVINYWFTYKDDIVIPKDDIVSHTKNIIVFKYYRDYCNFESTYMGYVFDGGIPCKSIENKENFIKYKETQLKTYEYFKEYKCWKLTSTNVIGTETVFEKTPLEVFNDNKSKYKLIETEEELNDYIKSTLDCNTWCRKKLYDKMKELGLGDGFINQFADLIGNNLDKYYAMIDLANEVTDKDTLMYLYAYKFGK